MDIDWLALVKVAVVSFAFGVGLVSVFSIGILGAAEASRGNAGRADGDEVTLGSRGGSRGLGIAVMGLCLAGCTAAVLYGLWLIIPQFH